LKTGGLQKIKNVPWFPKDKEVNMTHDLNWSPPVELSALEELILKNSCKDRKLFIFLREVRHILFDSGFQEELATMYRQTGAGLPPIPPALMAMATLLQKYTGVSDNELMALLFDSKRWQMVLDCLEANKPIFSQAAFFDFRMRMIATSMDQRLLERTVEVARQTGGYTKKGLRLALDSGPLEGHGKVEDTINLLGHAAQKVVACIAKLTDHTCEEMLRLIGVPLFSGSSIKAALDVDWSEPKQENDALERLYCELEWLDWWLNYHHPQLCQQEPLRRGLETIDGLIDQNLDLTPPTGGLVKMRDGVAPNRVISVEDEEMRHGRKSKSQRIDGFKNHIARDIEEHLILGACVTAANMCDAQAAGELLEASLKGERELQSVHIDRQYLHAEEILECSQQGVEVVCRSPVSSNRPGLFTKREFEIDLQRMEATCPQKQTIGIELGHVAEFAASQCDVCPVRERCTQRALGHGRTLQIHENEALYQRLRVVEGTKEGRSLLRKRVDVEHGLSHVSRRQGGKARYNGTRKNTFDLRILCSIQNLERAQALASSIPEARAA
jgi:hypothetical protein